jgi:hypothetical protein
LFQNRISPYDIKFFKVSSYFKSRFSIIFNITIVLNLSSLELRFSNSFQNRFAFKIYRCFKLWKKRVCRLTLSLIKYGGESAGHALYRVHPIIAAHNASHVLYKCTMIHVCSIIGVWLILSLLKISLILSQVMLYLHNLILHV